jgi:SAM-dependent methyltransferase
METPGRRVLEVGAGDGMLGAALTTFGHEVTLVDQEDWRDERARSISLKLADCSKKLPFGDASFDLVCSYNSFEHFPDPTVALSEMVRVVRPGGWIYTEFAPLYTGPWGLHAYRTLRMPYPQFLFSEQFVQRKLDELGIWDLGKKRTTLQYLNRWRVQQFEELWRRTDCQIVTRNLSTDESGLSLVIRFPESFRERGLTTEDIVAFGYSLAIRRT